jgi:hypothetical protein
MNSGGPWLAQQKLWRNGQHALDLPVLADVTAGIMLQMAVERVLRTQAHWFSDCAPSLGPSPDLARHVDNVLFIDFAHLAQSHQTE